MKKSEPVPKPESGGAPTLQSLLNEGHARLRRMNADGVYLGNLLDTLGAEIVRREESADKG